MLLKKIIEVKNNNKNNFCPTVDDIWNQHPRIYINLDNIHKKNYCPYCGTCFIIN